MDNISSIRRDVKSSIKKIQEKKTLVLVANIGIIAFTLFFFKLTFEEKSETIVEKYRETLNKNPYIKRDLKPLLTCKEITNDAYDYRLADYYISSSFNSPLIGNQKRDYVSLDFFKEVLDSGARYLEFQINPSSINDFPEPIVGTGDINNNWGDSANFLKLDDVLKTIRKSAFNNKMNYPLIIYLDFNSLNKYLIKRVGELINAYLGDNVVKNHTYVTAPFVFERICVFNKKVIFLSSLNKSDFMNTPLETIVMSGLGFVRRVYYDDVDKQSSIETTLSKKIQRQDNDKFNKNYATYNDILKKVSRTENKNKSFYDILVEEKYTNPLLHFNKVGLTIIIPHIKEDIFTANYEPQSYWDSGCQIVSMNFQESLERSFLDKINNPVYKLTSKDPIIIRYLSKFNKHSFILKSDTERFFETHTEDKPQEMFDIEDIKLVKLNINNNFMSNFVTNNNEMIVCMIQAYAYPDYYLDSNSGIIRFMNKDSVNNKAKSLNDYLFIFVPSKDEILNNKQAITIIPVNDIIDFNVNKLKVLTRNANDFVFRTVSDNSHSLIKKSSFYPVKSSCDETGDTISLRIVADHEPPYLGYDNKILTTYIKNDTNKMKESCCFNIIPKQPKIDINLFIYIKHQYAGRYLQGLDNDMCIFQNKTLDETNKFQIVMDNYKLNEPFNLKINDKFITYDTENNTLMSDTTDINNSSLFKIEKLNDTYIFKLSDINGRYNTTLNNINNKPVFNVNGGGKNTYKSISLSCYLKFELV